MITNDRGDIPEDSTVTGGAAVSGQSRDLRHNELQERYKMKHNGHLMDVLTDTKRLTDVQKPPSPPTYRMFPPQCMQQPLEHTDM